MDGTVFCFEICDERGWRGWRGDWGLGSREWGLGVGWVLGIVVVTVCCLPFAGTGHTIDASGHLSFFMSQTSTSSAIYYSEIRVEL